MYSNSTLGPELHKNLLFVLLWTTKWEYLSGLSLCVIQFTSVQSAVQAFPISFFSYILRFPTFKTTSTEVQIMALSDNRPQTWYRGYFKD